MITKNNITQHELIGLKTKVVEGNKTSIGIKGKVIDETMNQLIIETKNGEKKIMKNNTKFKFTLPSKTKVIVDGNFIKMRPEDRLKKRMKKW